MIEGWLKGGQDRPNTGRFGTSNQRLCGSRGLKSKPLAVFDGRLSTANTNKPLFHLTASQVQPSAMSQNPSPPLSLNSLCRRNSGSGMIPLFVHTGLGDSSKRGAKERMKRMECFQLLGNRSSFPCLGLCVSSSSAITVPRVSRLNKQRVLAGTAALPRSHATCYIRSYHSESPEDQTPVNSLRICALPRKQYPTSYCKQSKVFGAIVSIYV